jgi:hypothetical protein
MPSHFVCTPVRLGNVNDGLAVTLYLPENGLRVISVFLSMGDEPISSPWYFSSSSASHAIGSFVFALSVFSSSESCHDSGSLNIFSAIALPGTPPNIVPNGLAEIRGDSSKSKSG